MASLRWWRRWVVIAACGIAFAAIGCGSSPTAPSTGDPGTGLPLVPPTPVPPPTPGPEPLPGPPGPPPPSATNSTVFSATKTGAGFTIGPPGNGPFRYTRTDASFLAKSLRGGNAVEITVTPNDTDPYNKWSLSLSAKQGQLLLPGYYADAGEYPFQTGEQAGMRLAAYGRICGPPADFVVHEAVLGPDKQVRRLHVTFIQWCGSKTGGPYTSGELFIAGDVNPPSEVDPVPYPPAAAPPTPAPPAAPDPAIPTISREWAGRMETFSGLGLVDLVVAQNNSSITATVRQPHYNWLGTFTGTLTREGLATGTIAFGSGTSPACATTARVSGGTPMTTRFAGWYMTLDPPCPGIGAYMNFVLDRTCRFVQYPGSVSLDCAPPRWSLQPPAPTRAW